jgi:hypothetical protein
LISPDLIKARVFFLTLQIIKVFSWIEVPPIFFI